MDLLWLYRRAAAAAEPGTRVVLDEGAQTLSALVADLRATTDAAQPQWRQVPARWRRQVQCRATAGAMRAAANPRRAWLHTLGRRDAALLGAFEAAAARARPGTARLIDRQLPRLQELYLDMYQLVGRAT